MLKAAMLPTVLSWLCIWSVMMQQSRAGHFIEEPQTVNITAGDIAMFRCRHSDAEFLGWRFDGEPARTANLSGFSPQGNQLIFDALPEYNGSVIECVALYSDGTPSQTSRPALLIVQGGCNGTLAVAFIEEPQSQNVAQESTAKFRCRPTVADHTGFTLNGTSSTNFTDNVTVMFRGGGAAVLSVGAIPVYHGTIIVCVAAFDGGCNPVNSPEAVLLIQGPLQAVTNLDRGNIGGDFRRYSWDPPPTIDLTGIEPDIAYCITIRNITCGRDDLVISDCEVRSTVYRSQDIHPSLVYKVEVIPRSNVELARNGTPLPIKERFIDFEVSSTRFFEDVNTDNLTVSFKLIPNTTVPSIIIVPEQYNITVAAIDGTDKQPLKISRVEQGQVRNINFSLPSRRLWKYEFLAYGCKEHLLGSIMISTYEVQNITSSSLSGKISVTGQFIDGSATNRTLVIVYSHTNESEVRYTFGEGHSFQTNVSHLQGGTYGVAVFVVEENGTVFPRAAAQPQSVNYNSEASNISSTDQDMITFTSKPMVNSTGVCITCTFLESSTATDCVAVVHQRISQLNSSAGLMNIESSHKFTRSGDTAYGCIEGVNSISHQFGVVGGRLITENDKKKANDSDRNLVIYVVPAAVIVVMAISVVVVILLIVFIHTKKKKKGMNPNSGHRPGQSGGNAQYVAGGDGHGFQDDIVNIPDPVVNGDGHGGVNPENARPPQPTPVNSINDTNEESSRLTHRQVIGGRPRRRADGEPGIDGEFQENVEDPSPPTATPTPFDLEHLLAELMGVASKWKELGEALLLDDDLLDEIFTNNETDEECLRDMLERYLMRIDKNHSWEEMHAALRKIHVEEAELDATEATVTTENGVDVTRGPASHERVIVPNFPSVSRVPNSPGALVNPVLPFVDGHEDQNPTRNTVSASFQDTDENMDQYTGIHKDRFLEEKRTNTKHQSDVDDSTSSQEDAEETAPESTSANPIPDTGHTQSSETMPQRRVNPTAEMRRAPMSVNARGKKEPPEDNEGHEPSATPMKFRDEGPEPEYPDMGGSSEFKLFPQGEEQR